MHGQENIKLNEFRLFSFSFFRIVFISWCSLFISTLTIILFCDGINQILVRISSSPTAVLVQFNGSLLISVVGSKIENKVLISFSLETEKNRKYETMKKPEIIQDYNKFM